MKQRAWIRAGAGMIVVLALARPAPAKTLQELARKVVEQPTHIAEALGGRDDSESAALLLTVIHEAQATDLKVAVRRQRIVHAVSCAVRTLAQRAPLVLGAMGADVPQDTLAAVTAAAVLSAGDQAQAVLQALVESRPDAVDQETIRVAAQAPERALTRHERRIVFGCFRAIEVSPVRPQPIRPLPDGPPDTAPAVEPPSPPPPPLPYEGQ